MTSVDHLLLLPEFEEQVRKSGVRFFGLCSQSIFSPQQVEKIGGGVDDINSDFELKLPNDFPIEKFRVKFSSVPKEKPVEGGVIADLFESAQGRFFLENNYIIETSFEFTPKLLKYVHEQLPDFLRLDAVVQQDPQYTAWAYYSGLRNLAIFLVRHFTVYANICKAGALDLFDGYTIIGGKKSEVRSYTSALSSIASLEKEKGKRLLRELDFKKNWDFYCQLKGTLSGKPDSPIEIAVNNLTDLFDDSFDQSGGRNLIWGFAGLEAILADSETSIGSQLRQKLVALFGNQVDAVEFEKEISEIYRYRSKIIHGKDKAGSVLRSYGSQFFQSNKQDSETRIAIWLLLAVVQYCFQNRQTALKFKTVVI